MSQLISSRQNLRGLKYIFIFGMFGSFFQLGTHMAGDIRTRINLIKLLSHYYRQKDNKILQPLFSQQRYIQQLVNATAVQKLIQQQFFSDFVYETIRSSKSINKLQLITNLGQIKAKPMKDVKQLQFFQDLQIEQISPQLAQIILVKVAQLSPSSQQIVEYLQKLLNQGQDEKSTTKQIQAQQKKAQNFSQGLQIAHKLFIKAIYVLIVRLELAKQVRTYVINRCIPESKLQEIIYWLTVFAKQLFFLQQETNFSLVTLMLLIRESPSNSLQIQNLWSALLLSNIPQIQQGWEKNYSSNIPKLAFAFHFYITALLRADIFCIVERNKIHKQKSKKTKTTEDPYSKALQAWFTSYLYEKKTVSRSQIIELKKRSFLNFDEASQILNDYCQYDEKQQIFKYSNPRPFKNIVNKFPLLAQKQSFQALYKNTIYFGQEIQLQEGSLSSILLNQMLSCKIIISIFKQQWERTCKYDLQYLESEARNGYLYLFVLVVYDILTKGADQSVRSKLEEIRKNQQLLSFYSMREKDTYLIKRLLKMQNKQQNESPKIERNSEKKIQGEEKKKKIAEKFKKARENVLEKIKSQPEGQTMGDNQETCILCHEKQKQGNQLVYLGSINKYDTNCRLVHRENCFSNTCISTCFHLMHVNCFIKYQKKPNFSFNCPLCQAECNSIFPTLYDSQNIRLKHICQNAKIVYMAANYRIYDPESDFILIFKHLVESKGLNSILSTIRYKQKKKVWYKNDEFLFQLMNDIYNHSEQKQKAIYLQGIQDFATQIEACTRVQCKLVQLLLVEALKSAITRSTNLQNLTALLLKIRALIKQEQFVALQDQLHEFLHEDLKELPQQTQEEKSQPKASLSMNLIKLPKNLDESIKNFCYKICGICNKCQSDILCLVSGILLCLNCIPVYFDAGICSSAITCSIRNFQVAWVRKGYKSHYDIYFNEFKVSFSDILTKYRQQFSQILPKDFLLDEIKFKKIIDTFLEI